MMVLMLVWNNFRKGDNDARKNKCLFIGNNKTNK